MNPFNVILICAWSLTAAQQIVPIDKAEWLEQHNKVRRLEPAADMQELVWSDELEQAAARWAAGCKFEHTPPAERSRMKMGENLFMTPNAVSAEETIDSKGRWKEFSWYYEKNYYNHATKGCSGGMCGHYTALVWAKTCSVGCAVAKCSNLLVNGQWKPNHSLVVCNYGPAGNMIGQSPYQFGAKCSKCPGGGTCNNGLCTSTCSGGAASSGSTATNIRQAAVRPASTSGATDVGPRCCLWAMQGECDRNPWMRANCQKSCGTPGCTLTAAQAGDCEVKVDRKCAPTGALAEPPEGGSSEPVTGDSPPGTQNEADETSEQETTTEEIPTTTEAIQYLYEEEIAPEIAPDDEGEQGENEEESKR